MTQPKFRFFLSVLFIASILLPTATVAPVQASGYAYKWDLLFDFEADLNGVLSVEVGVNDGSGGVVQPALHSRTYAVGCKRIGPVALNSGHAQFNGGYLACAFDLRAALDNTFAECNALHPGCKMDIGTHEPYRSVMMAADTFLTATGLAPIFAHESTTFHVNVATYAHAVQTSFADVGATTSAQWVVSPSINAAYNHSAHFGCSAVGDCGTQYSVAGNADYVDTVDNRVGFATAATTFYIGRDVGGTVIAPGSMLDNIIVDPGNGLPD